MKHAVEIEAKRCLGCTTCMKSCPTEAIRVRCGKATILNDRCIDCGRCFQVCPHKAVTPLSDIFQLLNQFDYCIAVPDPTLYGQFQQLNQIDLILNGLLSIGFHEVFEAAKAAELLIDFETQYSCKNEERVSPVISSACPAVLRLICMRFPKLIPNILPHVTPIELAAILSRREASQKTGLPSDRIGVFSIVPCPAQVTASHNPEGLTAPVLDGAFSIRDVYLKLLAPMKKADPEWMLPLSEAGVKGISWAYSGGESAARSAKHALAVDGIENVIRVLEQLEDDRIPEADFIELSACTQGCLGGCLNVENPFASHMYLNHLTRELPFSRIQFSLNEEDQKLLKFSQALTYIPTLLLDEDRRAAMDKLVRIEKLAEELPGLHCGSCGAPNCRAFAEDVVLDRASVEDCIFKLRTKTEHMAGSGSANELIPAPFRHKNQGPLPTDPSDR
jgi:Na+-translocating ferredoxin:NAD+ oxidoreductase RNF subunit RnfB